MGRIRGPHEARFVGWIRGPHEARFVGWIRLGFSAAPLRHWRGLWTPFAASASRKVDPLHRVPDRERERGGR